MIFFVILAVAILAIPLATYHVAYFLGGIGSRKPEELGYKEVDLLKKNHSNFYGYDVERPELGSRAAYYVAEAFREIPERYRPFSGNELARTLKSLDLKWGKRADDHGHRIQYFEGEFDDWFWTCRCTTKWKRRDAKKHDCKLFDDYGLLVWEFHQIALSADEQERAFARAGMVEGSPDHLNMLIERARAESDIIQTVTRELLGTPEVDDSVLVSRVQTMRNRAKAIRDEVLR